MIRFLWRWLVGLPPEHPKVDNRNHPDPVVRICWSLENRAWEWSHDSSQISHPTGIRISVGRGVIETSGHSDSLFGGTGAEKELLAKAVRAYFAWKLDPVYPLDMMPPPCSPTPIKANGSVSITESGRVKNTNFTLELVPSLLSEMGSPVTTVSGSTPAKSSSSRAGT